MKSHCAASGTIREPPDSKRIPLRALGQGTQSEDGSQETGREGGRGIPDLMLHHLGFHKMSI